MRIGIACYPTVGGSGVVATELGHALADRGHEVHFITYEMPFRLRADHPQIHFHEVEIHAYELFKYPDYALTLAVKLAEVSKECNLDILHVHYAIPHATSAYLAKQILGTKSPAVITTLHGTDITLVGRDSSYFEIVRFSMAQSDGVTAVSKSLKQETQDYFQIDKPIQVIHNFFQPRPEILGTKPLRDAFVTKNEKLLLHSSNFRRVKRAEDVVHIFHLVREQVKSKLLLLGSGSGFESVKNLVRDYDLGKDVIFLGQSRYVDPYVASADLFLLPSSQESFGLAALEAMAYGVPVIASDVGGLPEVVVHGETGYLAPVGDVMTMATYAVQLLQDPALYTRMSRASTAHVQEHFSAEKIVPQYESFYETTLSRN